MKQLLIVSDDFGVTPSVNEGIHKAFEKGAIALSNIMAPCPWAPQAIALAKKHNWPVGIHLTLTCEWDNMRWRPLTDNALLKDEQGYCKREYADIYEAQDKQALKEAVINEYRAQVNNLLCQGVKLTHIDSHMQPNVNDDELNQWFVQQIEQICEEFNLAYLYAHKGKITRDQNAILPTISQCLNFTSRFGISGESKQQIFDHIAQLSDGIHLLISHCAVPSREQDILAEEGNRSVAWAGAYRYADFNLLMSDEFSEHLHNCGIQRVALTDTSVIK